MDTFRSGGLNKSVILQSNVEEPICKTVIC